ncbi:TIGR03943 family protein [Streptomyces sp. E11-3]|uniref:TIGR03943 family putative permease subunit n=1 Tax=Streptomyces sp. E11-3 TaxID=3110112 RepID=UPI003980D4BF
MRRNVQAGLLVLSGAAVLRISLFSDLYLRYVKPSLRPYLILSGGLLVALGLLAAIAAWRSSTYEKKRSYADEESYGDEASYEKTRSYEEADQGQGDYAGEDAGHCHDHSNGPRVGWLLAVPAAALLLFPPPALGSYSAEREEAARIAQRVGTFDALPDGDPVDLTLGQFTSRAVYDSGGSMTGRTLRLTGFVTRGDDGTWYATRLQISCCAADSRPIKVEVRDAAAPPDGAWVTVTGTWHPEGELGTDEAWPPVLEATAVRRVAEPENPYEKW